MKKSKVLVIRKWKEPEVKVFVTDSEIGVEMTLEEFLSSLVETFPNILLTATKAQLLNKLTTASKEVVGSMKQQTVHIL